MCIRDRFQTIFGLGDEPITFRRGFMYKICFNESDNPDFYNAEIKIGYEKIFKESEFIVACTDTEEKLEKLFIDQKVEYRWLIQGKESINFNDFNLERVMLNDNQLRISGRNKTSRGLEYIIKIPDKLNLLHKSAEFHLQFNTIHPISKKEFPVYIIHPTKGFEVLFDFSGIKIKKPKIFPFFSGKVRYPEIISTGSKIKVIADKEEWIFPNSGLLIYW